MNETNELYEKAKFFFTKDVAVHISKKNNWFHNGKIVNLEKEFLILIDEKTGEMPIFFNEIIEIEGREERR